MLRKSLSFWTLIGLMVVLAGVVTVSPSWGQGVVDRAGLNKLVQQMVDARSNYGENLHRLVAYYEKTANSRGEEWAKRELNEFRKIRHGEYLPGIEAKVVRVNQGALKESDIVESLVGYRLAYRKHLELLMKVLKEAKDVKRLKQAKREQMELISVNKYFYLRNANTPGIELRPTEKISAAEKLYKQAMALKKRSRGLVVRRYETQLAMETFRELIRKYPNSTRIDDAAYQIGELCQKNLKDYERAIRWYECVVAWDPETQLRANLRIAQIYDKHLVNRLTALDYYGQALVIEPRGSSSRKDIEQRIKRLRGR